MSKEALETLNSHICRVLFLSHGRYGKGSKYGPGEYVTKYMTDEDRESLKNLTSDDLLSERCQYEYPLMSYEDMCAHEARLKFKQLKLDFEKKLGIGRGY